MYPLIGISGLIGSGKSAVARLVAEAGYYVLHADDEAHVVYATNTLVRSQLAQTFGPEILTAEGVDRVRLGSRVFADPNELAKLEAIIHPALALHLQARLSKERSLHPVFLEAALLPKWPDLLASCDQVWEVWAPETLRLSRVVARGLSVAEANKRIEQQRILPALDHRCVVRVENAASLLELDQHIQTLLHLLR